MLKKGDVVDLIAPGYGMKHAEVEGCVDFLRSLGLTPRVQDNLLGDDPFSSNSQEVRQAHVIDALSNKESKAVWCLKGGYGTAQLIPALANCLKPETEKLLIGFSDITALHLWCTQAWGWKTLHAPVVWQLMKGAVDEESITLLTQQLFGELSEQRFTLTPLNALCGEIEDTSVTGGNLMLLQCSIGTCWTLDTKDKLLFIEDIDERAYRVERILVHLEQAGMLGEAKGVIFGDFSFEADEAQVKMLQLVKTRFAAKNMLPVYSVEGIGHGKKNHPLMLNVGASIDNKNVLRISLR